MHAETTEPVETEQDNRRAWQYDRMRLLPGGSSSAIGCLTGVLSRRCFQWHDVAARAQPHSSTLRGLVGTQHNG